MTYTAKKLADISGVSVRTLHWYDKIGLLQPANYGENGYRYYEKEQLLLLQQILFFRELGMPLEEIKDILQREDFDQIETLEQHRDHLFENLKRTQTLINTVDLTISNLKGETKMNDQDLYQGFHEWSKDQGSHSYGLVPVSETNSLLFDAEQIVLQSRNTKNTENWAKEAYQKLADRGHSIFSSLTEKMKKGFSPNDKGVQKIIKAHYEYTMEFHHLTPKVYKALAEMYRSHVDFRKQLDHHDHNLAEFMSEAMEYFANDLKKK
jgi:DNA-binding transcriptional MerR regulator